MALTAIDSITIDHPDSGTRQVQLYQGDLTDMTPQNHVEFLVVSALPGDYFPSEGSLIQALDVKGISVQSLSQNKAKDYHPTMPCWISQTVRSSDPGIQFERLLVYEPADPAWNSNSAWMIDDIFRAIQCFKGNADTRVAMPLVSTGSGEAHYRVIGRMLATKALRYGGLHDFNLLTSKIVVYNTNWETDVTEDFKAIKHNYDNFYENGSPDMPGQYATFATQAWSHVDSKNLNTPTEKQAWAIVLWTTNYYSVIEGPLYHQPRPDLTNANLIKLQPYYALYDAALEKQPRKRCCVLRIHIDLDG